MQIQAAVCHEFGAPLVVETLALAPPGPGEVRVALKAAAICHSDVSSLRGHWAGGVTPTVAGHEAAGIVESVGPGVDAVATGDYVVVTLVRSCGNCRACRAGHTVACSGTTALDRETRLHDASGSPVQQGLRTAAFAQACVVHESQVVGIDPGLPFVSAALLGCGVITGYCSVTRVAQVGPGATVAVTGVGGLGLNTIQGAVLAGAETVVAIDVVTQKLELARAFGATHTIDARNEDPVAAVLGICEGGVDFAFVTVGMSRAFSDSMRMLNRTGKSVILGMPGDDDKDFVVDSHLLTTGRSVLGSKLGDTCTHEDIPALAGLYREGRLKLDEIVSATYPLSAINDALDAAERGESLRNVIVFD